MIPISKIEQIIGYVFDNKDLLQQAFVRKTYAEENGGQHNEVLELIGDNYLGAAVMGILEEKFGEIAKVGPKYLFTKYDEGKLTDIKKEIVNKYSLADAMDKLGLHKYLIMGKGDVNQNRQNDVSVKEDLFEAIIGAVTKDCNKNMDIITRVTKNMFDFESYFKGDFQHSHNYVGLVQEWFQSHENILPRYHFMNAFDESIGEVFVNTYNNGKGITKCQLHYYYYDRELFFNGLGDSNDKAKENCAECFYNWLADTLLSYEPVLDSVGEPDRIQSTRQLNELYQKRIISEPIYSFTQCYDEYGDLRWECDCYVEENGKSFCSRANTKKEAQRMSAYEALRELIDQLK